MLYLLFSLTMLALDPCLVVDGPQIHAGDLAPQLPVFATLAPATVLASAPNFGVRRDLSIQTLRLWANTHALKESDFDSVCIFRRAAVPEDFVWETEISQALKDLLGLQLLTEQIQIREKKISPGPKGHLALQRSGLSYIAAKKQYLWHGKIEGSSGYAAARICFTMQHSQSRLVTARNLPAGKLVEVTDLESISLPWHPEDSKVSEPSIQFEGRILRRSLTKGAILLSSHLTEAPLIRPGDPIVLISQAGSASIRTPAVARGKARLGDPLLVATLEGKRLLRAIAVAPGTVEIRATAGKKAQ